jgi:hypothetical protein
MFVRLAAPWATWAFVVARSLANSLLLAIRRATTPTILLIARLEEFRIGATPGSIAAKVNARLEEIESAKKRERERRREAFETARGRSRTTSGRRRRFGERGLNGR